MNRDDFEARVLKLWTTTQIPLTRTNLQLATGEPRRKVERWLDELVREGVLELSSDDEGDLCWVVLGARRSGKGLSSVEDWLKLQRLEAEVGVGVSRDSGSSALRRVEEDEPFAEVSRPLALGGGDKKSVVASGLLSLFFGPFGWLYAAPLKEALPAVLGYVIICSIVPKFLLIYLMGPIGAVSAVMGVLYAWSYNQSGGRTALWGRDKISKVLPPRRW